MRLMNFSSPTTSSSELCVATSVTSSGENRKLSFSRNTSRAASSSSLRFQSCSKPISSICATLNFAPASAYSLQSVAMACGAGLSVSREPEAKSFSVNSRALACESCSSFCKISASRAVVVGDVARQFHVVAEKTVGDNRAGRADRFIAEQNRLLRGQRAEAVMVNDLNDFNFVRALDGLRKFVVIHQN